MSVLSEFLRKAYLVARITLGGGDLYVDENRWHARLDACKDCPILVDGNDNKLAPCTVGTVSQRGKCGKCSCPITRLALFNINPQDLCSENRWK